ncbi:MAG: DUF1934 domain-containing protein [Butyrivibrio sp.]|nr:DUF1934 domain-containing protein [Butyrivibrio sp.]
MKKEIEIKLSSRHDRPGEEPELSEIKAYGEYEFNSGVHEIFYIEKQQVQDENGKVHELTSQNTVKIFDDRIEITRLGEATSHMIFSEGSTKEMNYNTPYGLLKMEIFTNRLVNRIDENTIKIEVDYSLNMEGQKVSSSKIVYDMRF